MNNPDLAALDIAVRRVIQDYKRSGIRLRPKVILRIAQHRGDPEFREHEYVILAQIYAQRRVEWRIRRKRIAILDKRAKLLLIRHKE